MATQAYDRGDAAQALDLASAGLDCGSPLTEARCAAWQGRAHALRGDQRACAQACSTVERALDRAAPADERLWFKFFTVEHMAAEMLYMASDLGRHDDVQRLAPGVLASSGGMARRHVLGTTAFARSYLPSQGNSHSDIDQACDLLGQVIPSLGSLSSTRSLERVNSVRRALAAHAGRPSVQEVEQRFRFTIPAVMSDQLHHLLRMSVRPYLTLRVVPAALGAHAGIAGHFKLMEFAEFKPVAYLESQTSCLFLERPEEIAAYQSILATLAGTALKEGESRELIATLATEFSADREDHDDRA